MAVCDIFLKRLTIYSREDMGHIIRSRTAEVPILHIAGSVIVVQGKSIIVYAMGSDWTYHLCFHGCGFFLNY